MWVSFVRSSVPLEGKVLVWLGIAIGGGTFFSSSFGNNANDDGIKI